MEQYGAALVEEVCVYWYVISAFLEFFHRVLNLVNVACFHRYMCPRNRNLTNIKESHSIFPRMARVSSA